MLWPVLISLSSIGWPAAARKDWFCCLLVSVSCLKAFAINFYKLLLLREWFEPGLQRYFAATDVLQNVNVIARMLSCLLPPVASVQKTYKSKGP